MIEACMASAGSGLSIFTDGMKIVLSVSSLAAAVAALFFVGKTGSIGKKSLLLYSHVVLMVFPIVLLTTHSTCGYFCLSCYSDPLHLLSLVVPTTMISSTFASLFLVPFALVRLNGGRKIVGGWISSKVGEKSMKMGVKKPDLFVVDRQVPVAFSFRGLKSAIFVSIGMMELFTKKEIEAVILHEMMHIKRGSSMLKFSSHFFRIFSPAFIVFGFNDGFEEEEKIADRFASSEQGTRKHLSSAKAKIREFRML